MTTTEPKPVARDVSHGTALKPSSPRLRRYRILCHRRRRTHGRTFVGAGPVLFSIMGPGVPLVYIMVALVIALFAVGYLKMSRHIVHAGGFVAYIARGLGRHAATGAAGTVMVTYIARQVGFWAQFGVFAQQLVARWLGIDLPVWVLGPRLHCAHDRARDAWRRPQPQDPRHPAGARDRRGGDPRDRHHRRSRRQRPLA